MVCALAKQAISAIEKDIKELSEKGCTFKFVTVIKKYYLEIKYDNGEFKVIDANCFGMLNGVKDSLSFNASFLLPIICKNKAGGMKLEEISGDLPSDELCKKMDDINEKFEVLNDFL